MDPTSQSAPSRSRVGSCVLACAALGVLLRRPDLELLLIGLGLAWLAFTPRSSGARAGWLAVSLLAIERVHGVIPRGVVVHGGLAVGVAFVGVAAGVAFFAFARAGSARTGAPSGMVVMAATLLACVTGVEGALRLRERGEPDVVKNDAAPLVALDPYGTRARGPEPRPLLGPGDRERPDLRGRSFSPRKPPGTFRVALLGGSSAWGHAQTSWEASPAGQLETRLSASRGRVEVLCLAHPGYTSDQSLGVVAGGAIDWDVDLWVALDGYNDLGFTARAESYPGYMYFWPQHAHGFTRPFARSVWSRSTLLRRFVAPAVTLPLPSLDDHLLSGRANAFWLDGLVANETALAALARDAGGRFVWAPQPLLQDRVSMGPGEQERGRRPDLAPEIARRAALVRTTVAAAVKAQGGAVIDLPAALRERSRAAKDETWFLDECHWSDRGVEVVTEELSRALAR